MITRTAVERYRRDGYLVVPNLIGGPEIAALQQVIDRLMADAGSVDTHDDVYDLEPGHTRAVPRVRRIKAPHRIDRGFLDVVRADRVIEVLWQLLGPDLRLHGSKLNIKAPRYGSPVEWHQDWAFYPHTNDDILAIGVMLDDMDMVNGPLLLVPGTHQGPVWDHQYDGRLCGAVDPASIAAEVARAVPITGKAGTMSFHHMRLLHGSAENTSNRRRTVAAVRGLRGRCLAADGRHDVARRFRRPDDRGPHDHRTAGGAGSRSHAVSAAAAPGFDLRKPGRPRPALFRDDCTVKTLRCTW